MPRLPFVTCALVLLLVAALLPPSASAQVDDWRVLHVGLQSGASVDTDGDGVVNSWRDCRTNNRGNVRCTKLERSNLYKRWQTDVACTEQTIEAWTDYQIDVVSHAVFIETPEVLRANPYEFAWSGYADAYGFENYDVIMVWTAYTQALGFDGGTWNGVTGGYSFIALHGVAGHCDLNAWPASVAPHEFVHSVTGLYAPLGYPVCGTYEYTHYWQYHGYGEWEGHQRILNNSFPEITCASGLVSTGVPADAWASGSWTDHY